MKLKTGLVSVLAFGWICLGLVTTSQAGLTLKYDALGLQQSNALSASPFIANVDVLVRWDGIGANAFSGVDFDVTTPAGVRLLDDAAPPNPLGFGFVVVGGGSASFASFNSDIQPLTAGVDKALTTLSFEVTPIEGSFPLGLAVTYAQSGTNAAIQDITGQFSTVPGNLNVAVPEPSSLALLGVVSLAGFGWRRRRIS
jgi:hypothetical protein